MGNEFITIKNIARQILPRLIENLVFPNLIHKDYSDTYVNGLGATIQVKKPVILEAKEFDETVGTTAQDVKEQSVEVTLDKLATVDVEFGAIQRATNVDDLNRLFLEPAAVALAQKINSDGLFLYKDIPYISGTAGTTPSVLADIANVRKVLNENKVPVAGRRAVWDTEADAKFTTIEAIVNAEKSGSTQALREGSIGRIFGLDNYMSQEVKNHVKGTLAAGGTGGKITVKTAVATAAKQIVLDVTASSGGTLTGTLVKGDILTIDGKTYTVTKNATAADNEITVDIYPAIVVAADEEVTVVGSHTANLAFNPNAFAFVTRPLIAPAGVESYVTSYNGVTLRVVRGYNMQFKKEMLSMDVLYGYKTMYEELAARVLG
jgi:hypothetical protein